MPFVFLAAVVAATVYVLRVRRLQTASHAGASTAIRSVTGTPTKPVGIRGWLLVYVIGLAVQLAHGLALTVGSLVVYAKPSLAGLHTFIPLWALLIYVVSNLGLVAYGAVIFGLMSKERRAAIVHNVLFNALSIVFLLIWFVLSAKSPVGTVVDSLPGVVAIAYFSRSRRVRNTFTSPGTSSAVH